MKNNNIIIIINLINVKDEDITTINDRSRNIKEESLITISMTNFLAANFFLFLNFDEIASKTLKLKRKNQSNNIIVVLITFL